MRNTLARLFFSLSVAFILAACQTPEPEALPPEDIVRLSAERMNSLSGFEFIIERSGEPVYLDLDDTIAFRRAEGHYVAPDKAQATVRIITPGLVTDVGVVSIGQTQWETDLFTPQWRELPADWGFNPAVLFDPEIGMQSILLADLSDLVLEGTEKIEDGPDQLLYVIGGNLAGERLHEMSYRMIGPESMAVQLWIIPETFELYRVLITDPSQGGPEPTIWQIDFRQFGEVIEIVPPIPGDSQAGQEELNE
jgi:lipoprotein LprG